MTLAASRHCFLLLLACLCGCGPATSADDGPKPDAIARLLAARLADPAVAGYLIERSLADAEAVRPQPGLQVAILLRRQTADAGHLVLRLRITGSLEVVRLPPPSDAAAAAAGEAATPAMARTIIERDRRLQAKRVPAAQRTALQPVVCQVQVQARRSPGGWDLVLPADIGSEKRP